MRHMSARKAFGILGIVLGEVLLGCSLPVRASAADGRSQGAGIVLGELPAEYRGPAHATSVIRRNVRFQVLTPTLIRMEYSPSGKFADEPSTAVLKRAWDSVSVKQREVGDWIEVDTSKMIIRYRKDSGSFTARNLEVTWNDGYGTHVWKPGDKDDKNLGGIHYGSEGGDIRGRTSPVDQPGPLSRNGYFLLDDSGTALWDQQTEWVKPRPEAHGQDWYFFTYGHNYKEMLGELAKLLGPIPMIPRYVLGAWIMSRAGYNSDGWKLNVERFRGESLPVDVIGVDSASSSKILWVGRDIDREQLPDPKEFFHWMRKKGIRVFVTEHYRPLTQQNDSHFEEMRRASDLPLDAKKVPYDLASKKYAEAFMDVLNRPLLDDGMAFWLQDGWAYETKMRGLDPALWTRYVEYQGNEEVTGERAFDLCRIGGWGSHRYGSYFTGDRGSFWSGLGMLVPYHVQAGNALLPYVATTTASPETIDQELYQRSVEFGALSQIFWLHSLWGLRFPGEYGSQTLDLTRKFLQLRYRLIPYMYTYSRLAHDNGVPMVRGLYIDYPEQERSYTYGKQEYLFGDDLLVAPITEPNNGRAVLKNIYLPEGERWIDFFKGTLYDGGQVIPYLCPVGCVPLFVRAGSILPMAPDMDYSDQRAVNPLTLDIYAGKPASFRLYEDDGTSLDYRKGAYAWTTISYSPGSVAGEHGIEISRSQGEYRGQEQSRRYEIKVHGLLKPEVVKLDGQPLAEKRPSDCGTGCGGWTWDEHARVTAIHVAEAQPISQTLRVTLEGAGSSADAEMLQKVLDYRKRVQNVRDIEQLKWALLLAGLDIKKPPRAIRETDALLSELNTFASQPRGLAERPPDFRAMTEKLLWAFVDQPFESNRTIPEEDPEAIKATAKIEHGVFLPEELNQMMAELLGCELFTDAWGAPSPVVDAKLTYDPMLIGSAQVAYSIEPPSVGVPVWMQPEAPQLLDSGFTRFNIRAPFLVGQGDYEMKVRATLTWNGGHVELEREVPWYSIGGLTKVVNSPIKDSPDLGDYVKGVMTDVGSTLKEKTYY